MGKNAQARRWQAAGTGIEYRAGLLDSHPDKPVMLQFTIGGENLLRTNWAPDVAEAMAYGLLKMVELARQGRHLPKPAPVPVPVPQPPIERR